MGFKENMMDKMMGNMSSEDKQEMMDKMMENFFGGMTSDEKKEMMKNILTFLSGNILEKNRNLISSLSRLRT